MDATVEPARNGRPAMLVVRRTIDVAGTPRAYLVAVPQGYDLQQPHALVFGFHGSGGDREQLRRYLNLEGPAGGRAVFIYPSGVPQSATSTTAEWGLSASSPDLVLVDELIAQYTGELCVDRTRIFATGHSFGGCFTNALGCFRGDVFRAIAPVAGCGPSGAKCVGRVAALQIHSPKDTQVRYGTAIRLCTRWMRANGCGEMPMCGCNWTDQLTSPADQCMQQSQQPYQTAVMVSASAQDEQPPVLRAYQGCAAGYPSVFIDHWRREKAMVGDPTERWHNPPPWSAAVIWEFFSRL